MRLAGRVAVVTGGGAGIGAAYAAGLAREGASVVVVDLDGPSAARVAREIVARGGRALAVEADVTDPDAVEAMVRRAVSVFGGIQVLINNAALYSALERKTFEEVTPDEWDLVMRVNVKSAWLCTRACSPYLKERGGSVVNVSSSSVWQGLEVMPHYVASKAAVVGLTRSLARALGRYGVRVNCVAPGLTRTGRNVRVPEEAWAWHRQNRCIPRDETPEDLVGVVVWLASDESAFVTGQTILVDGGLHFV